MPGTAQYLKKKTGKIEFEDSETHFSNFMWHRVMEDF